MPPPALADFLATMTLPHEKKTSCVEGPESKLQLAPSTTKKASKYVAIEKDHQDEHETEEEKKTQVAQLEQNDDEEEPQETAQECPSPRSPVYEPKKQPEKKTSGTKTSVAATTKPSAAVAVVSSSSKATNTIVKQAPKAADVAAKSKVSAKAKQEPDESKKTQPAPKRARPKPETVDQEEEESSMDKEDVAVPEESSNVEEPKPKRKRITPAANAPGKKPVLQEVIATEEDETQPENPAEKEKVRTKAPPGRPKGSKTNAAATATTKKTTTTLAAVPKKAIAKNKTADAATVHVDLSKSKKSITKQVSDEEPTDEESGRDDEEVDAIKKPKPSSTQPLAKTPVQKPVVLHEASEDILATFLKKDQNVLKLYEEEKARKLQLTTLFDHVTNMSADLPQQSRQLRGMLTQAKKSLARIEELLLLIATRIGQEEMCEATAVLTDATDS